MSWRPAETKYGWRYYFKPGELYNPRTFYNFPIQAHGSEMLRRALIDLTFAGIEVNALIHDGIVITLNKKNFRKEFIQAKEILINASKAILNEDSSTNNFHVLVLEGEGPCTTGCPTRTTWW